MKNTLLTSISILLFQISYGQVGNIGSGNTLNFSNNTSVSIPDSPIFNHPNNTLSMETWIFPTQSVTGTIFCKIETDFTREYDIFLLNNGRIRFGLFNTSNTFYNTVSNNTIPLNTWTHVAATYSPASGLARIYINGVLDIANNIGNIVIQSSAINPLIGAYWNPVASGGGTRNHFIGQIDEVRLWHSERTQQQIRDNMCRTIPPQANLIAYYRLDEASGTTTLDASGNNNTGTLLNFPQSQLDDRPFSGAPIGNASVNNYTGTTSLQLSSATGGTMNLQSISGNHSGIHLYRVDALPSQTNGLGSPIPIYFGTFIAGGSGTSYNTSYNYTNTNLENGSCEENYLMQQRPNNAVGNWIQLNTTDNTTNNTMNSTGNTTRKEIILDPTCSISLPLEFISFELSKNTDKTATLYWITKNEINTIYFEIERSSNAKEFYSIGKLESKKSGTQLSYSFTDKNPLTQTSFYRLKQVDVDQKFSFSETKTIFLDESIGLSFYPNPSNGTIVVSSLEKTRFCINDLHGKELVSMDAIEKSTKELDLSFLPSGLYFITSYSGNTKRIQKLIIQ